MIQTAIAENLPLLILCFAFCVQAWANHRQHVATLAKVHTIGSEAVKEFIRNRRVYVVGADGNREKVDGSRSDARECQIEKARMKN